MSEGRAAGRDRGGRLAPQETAVAARKGMAFSGFPVEGRLKHRPLFPTSGEVKARPGSAGAILRRSWVTSAIVA